MNHAPAPQPSYRLIPSQFPPIGLFDSVARAADLAAVMELAGWTNDRLVAERIDRLPREEWVYGRPNASIIMAAFLHVAPTGMRFNRPELGAWYAAADMITASVEVAHHLRREAIARGHAEARRTYRSYRARLIGDYLDIRGEPAEYPELHDPENYNAAQAFGEKVRADGGNGILYRSARLRDGTNVVAFRPTRILDVVQASHFEITVHAEHRHIEIRQLNNQDP